jgi:hypothetical protein
MLRHRSPALLAVPLLALAIGFAGSALAPAASAQTPAKEIVGPARIYFVDADTVLALATKEWQSGAVRHQEKLLRTALRLKYWRDRIPSDMRMVFDALGYPTGRVLSQPMGHQEEWWYYSQLQPPLRFRDGVLLDRDRFEALARR